MPVVYILGDVEASFRDEVVKLFCKEPYRRHIKVVRFLSEARDTDNIERPFFFVTHGSCGKNLDDIKILLRRNFPGMEINTLEVKVT